jgi:hypothetical protein
VATVAALDEEARAVPPERRVLGSTTKRLRMLDIRRDRGSGYNRTDRVRLDTSVSSPTDRRICWQRIAARDLAFVHIICALIVSKRF